MNCPADARVPERRRAQAGVDRRQPAPRLPADRGELAGHVDRRPRGSDLDRPHFSVAVGVPRAGASRPGVDGAEPRTLRAAELAEVAGRVDHPPARIDRDDRDARRALLPVLLVLFGVRKARASVEGKHFAVVPDRCKRPSRRAADAAEVATEIDHAAVGRGRDRVHLGQVVLRPAGHTRLPVEERTGADVDRREVRPCCAVELRERPAHVQPLPNARDCVDLTVGADAPALVETPVRTDVHDLGLPDLDAADTGDVAAEKPASAAVCHCLDDVPANYRADRAHRAGGVDPGP